jgi:hypothetical protein
MHSSAAAAAPSRAAEETAPIEPLIKPKIIDARTRVVQIQHKAI